MEPYALILSLPPGNGTAPQRAWRAPMSPGAAALRERKLGWARVMSQDEREAKGGGPARLGATDHRGRTRATRKHPRVDWLASARLTRRGIVPPVHLLGLEQPAMDPLAWLVPDPDAGRLPPSEAPAVESVWAGVQSGIAEGDQLFAAASGVFDRLWSSVAPGAAGEMAPCA